MTVMTAMMTVVAGYGSGRILMNNDHDGEDDGNGGGDVKGDGDGGDS